MRDRVTGDKKQSQESTSIIDPVTEKEVTKVDDIKAVLFKYCTDLLTNRPPRPGYEDDIACKMMLHEVRMLESDNDTEIALTHDTFESSLKELSVKNPDKYYFILRAGSDFKDALFNLYEKVWNSEDKPEQWSKTKLVQLYKGKGDPKMLSNLRNIM